MLKAWLKMLGEEVRAARKASGLKHDVFAREIGVSKATLSIMANGTRSYGVDGLLAALAAGGRDPVKVILKQELPEVNSEHQRLHEKLEAVLNGESDLASAARINVETVYDKHLATRGGKRHGDVE